MSDNSDNVERPPAATPARLVAVALAVMLLSHGSNYLAARAGADVQTGHRVEAGAGRLYLASLQVSAFGTPGSQRNRYRRRARRRRPVKKARPASRGGIVSTRSGRVPAGAWGGAHISMQVTEGGATFEIDCAHGTIEAPLSLDAHGRFDNRGEYVRESGGPDLQFPRPDTHPARFTGWSDGHRMTLKIVLTDSGQTIGEFELTLGAEPQITKCL